MPISVNDSLINGIDEVFSNITLSPNPTHDRLSVSIKKSSEILKWTIFDITGKKISSSTLNDDGIIELDGITAGVYILKLNGKNSLTNRKIIVQ